MDAAVSLDDTALALEQESLRGMEARQVSGAAGGIGERYRRHRPSVGQACPRFAHKQRGLRLHSAYP